MIDIKSAIRKRGHIEWCSCCDKATPDHKRITFTKDDIIYGGTSIVLCPECMNEFLEKLKGEDL